MFKRVTRGWLTRAGIAAALGALAIFTAVTMVGSNTANAAGDITWSVSGDGVHGVGTSFTVGLDATNNTSATWGGYGMQLAYGGILGLSPDATTNTTGALTGFSVVPGGACNNPASNWADPQNVPTIVTGCAFQVNTTSGTTENVSFTCLAPGTAALHFVTLAEDSTQGSGFFDPDAAPLATDTVDGSVTCVLPITKSDDTGGTALAGSTVNYTVHVGNPGSISSFGHTISDTVPAPLTVTGVTSTNGALDGCSNTGNVVSCTTATVQPDPTGLDVTITATVPLSAAGTTGICNTATLDGVSTTAPDCFDVAAASLTVTKVANQASVQAGDPISWTVTVTSNGPSTAAGVVLTDTPTDGWIATDPLVYNIGDMPSGDVQVFVINGNVTDPQPADNTCDNSATAASTNGATATIAASTNCLSKNVGLVKSTDCDNAPTGTGGNVNLFLDNDGSKLNPLAGLTVCEWALNVGGDPQGVGAFEFDLAYNNKLFDVSIAATNWLYDTGRVPDAGSGVGGCAATIFTENDIRFGCVSKNPQPLSAANGTCLSTDNVTPVDGAVCGNKDNGVIAIVTVTPKSDLLSQITPGNSNGVIGALLDSGCEFADIWGHPLSAAIGAPVIGTAGNGYDALGREIPLPGIAAGGQVINCGNLNVTIRILEGDMNTDCSVDATDDQIEAANYGGTFGNQFYSQWYDLEPALKDGDVDIKDLQKVFGRNGSTCTTPVPPQDALPLPGDP